MNELITFAEDVGIYAAALVAVFIALYRLASKAIDKTVPILREVADAHVKSVEKIAEANVTNTEILRELTRKLAEVEVKVDEIKRAVT